MHHPRRPPAIFLPQIRPPPARARLPSASAQILRAGSGHLPFVRARTATLRASSTEAGLRHARPRPTKPLPTFGRAVGRSA